MPVSRDADGNIIDEPTRVAGRPADDRPTDVGGAAQPSGDYDAKTVLAGSVRREAQQAASDADEARTRIYRPGRTTTSPPTHDAAAAVSEPASTDRLMEDPPVGWLVVVGGPGQGATLTLGNGVNSLGRDASERLSLDFGDEMISRSGHATVTYDPRGKKFYIQHGGGTNLTYVNDQPVLAPQELTANTHILVGDTTLRFVPLCGADFDWDMAD